MTDTGISEEYTTEHTAVVDQDSRKKAQNSDQKRTQNRRKYGPRTTNRDHLLKRSLYTALALPTEQIAKMYFPSAAYKKDPGTEELHYSEYSAKKRLYKLLGKGVLLKDHYTPLGEDRQRTYWFLTQNQYRRQAYAAGRPGESYPPLPERLTHHFKTTEIYARIQPSFEELFAQLDGYVYPEWRWENESHATTEYFFGGENKKHQPDARVHMPDGKMFIIERQTKESREAKSVVKDKVTRADSYRSYRGYSKEDAKLLFACDTERDKEYVREALQESSAMKGVLGDTDTIVKYLLTRAREIVEQAQAAGEAEEAV
ncbi:hypothetical protein [Rubrobacter aplysinae]|uniref:hypothetical protein n=1 Tax=Rubrobacter aplysinae TaxID=909625 RepID=UPI00064B9982|nr:hypothetical protein [Rubrobacter aplysinae]